MTTSERLVRFELLGQEFAYYTATPEKEMDAILSLVREELDGDSNYPRGTVPASKIAMMACLNIASKYIQLKEEYESYKGEAETRVVRLSKDIQDSLQNK